MTTYQYQLCNASWVDLTEEQAQNSVTAIAKREQVYCPAVHAKQGFLHFANANEVLAFLAAKPGITISTGSDWYDNIRAKPIPRVAKPVEMVKCSCGHTVPKGSVMSASLGSACPDCYDRMSN